jgi:DNA-directed RNA polymerase sigma subunit (sigma70/sigma32)
VVDPRFRVEVPEAGTVGVRPRSGTVARADASLDAPLDEEGDLTRLDLIEDERPSPEAECAASESDRRLRDSLERVRGRLGDIGWDVVHARLLQDPPDTLEQIGKRWGVSREWVRQIERATKRFLRQYLEQRGGEPESPARAA